jgi:YD repeat-containing protein
MVYDQADRLAELHSASGERWRLTTDAADRVIRAVARTGEVVELRYDGLGRCTWAKRTHGSDVVITGRIFDTLGRLVEEIVQVNGERWAMTFEQFVSEHPAELTNAAAQPIGIDSDALGRPILLSEVEKSEVPAGELDYVGAQLDAAELLLGNNLALTSLGDDRKTVSSLDAPRLIRSELNAEDGYADTAVVGDGSRSVATVAAVDRGPAEGRKLFDAFGRLVLVRRALVGQRSGGAAVAELRRGYLPGTAWLAEQRIVRTDGRITHVQVIRHPATGAILRLMETAGEGEALWFPVCDRAGRIAALTDALARPAPLSQLRRLALAED